jgi:hypothetical protein
MLNQDVKQWMQIKKTWFIDASCYLTYLVNYMSIFKKIKIKIELKQNNLLA